ncbi:MAG: hypothetical protein NTU53_07085 [Planctomycetota bacterium]|nr:hypothetical protein [Planctomycetota bacterium]
MEKTSGQQLDYATPVVRRRRFWLGPTLIWSMVVLVWLLGGLFVVPRFEAIFKDFKVQLPTVTLTVLAWSRWLRGGFGWLALLPLPVVIAFLVPPTPDRHDARASIASRILLVLGLFVLVLSVFVFVAALMLPLLPLSGAISGK